MPPGSVAGAMRAPALPETDMDSMNVGALLWCWILIAPLVLLGLDALRTPRHDR